jgi:hypothetical protein
MGLNAKTELHCQLLEDAVHLLVEVQQNIFDPDRHPDGADAGIKEVIRIMYRVLNGRKDLERPPSASDVFFGLDKED